MTVILGALDSEIVAVTTGMEVREERRWNGYPLFLGEIAGEPVVVSRTGVGKTLSAMLTQHLIDLYKPERLLFTGVAGALDPELNLGDVVIGSETLHHDMDATVMGFQPGQIPYSEFRLLAADSELIRLAERVDPQSGKARTGLVLTGDQVIGATEERERLVAAFGGLAVEMEGASVGLVCTVNEVPFLLLRTISDHADQSVVDFRRVLKVAAANSWHYLRQILERVKE